MPLWPSPPPAPPWCGSPAHHTRPNSTRSLSRGHLSQPPSARACHAPAASGRRRICTACESNAADHRAHIQHETNARPSRLAHASRRPLCRATSRVPEMHCWAAAARRCGLGGLCPPAPFVPSPKARWGAASFQNSCSNSWTQHRTSLTRAMIHSGFANLLLQIIHRSGVGGVDGGADVSQGSWSVGATQDRCIKKA